MYLKVLSDDFLLYPSVPDEEMCTLDNGVIGGDVFEGPPSSIHAPPPSSCCCCNTALLVNAALLPLSFQFNHHKNHQHHHPNHSHDHHQLHCSHHNHASLLSIIIIIISEFCCAAVVALLRPIWPSVQIVLKIWQTRETLQHLSPQLNCIKQSPFAEI